MEDKIFDHIIAGRFQAYLEQIPFIDKSVLNRNQQSILQVALAYGREDIAYDIIVRGVNVDHQDEDGGTALHYAAAHSNLRIARLLVEKGGNINLTDKHGNNALWTATFNARGKYEIVKLYVDHGGDSFHKNKAGRSPFDFAMQIQDETLTKILNPKA